MLDEREFELINIIGPKLGSNQRDLSRKMDISLGMVNMLIRRLVSKGFIRIQQLNSKKVEYILTPEGFREKMQKTIQYTMKTINSIGLIKEQLKVFLQALYDVGERKFLVFGESDLTFLIETVVHELALKDCVVTKIAELPADGQPGTLLVCKENIFDKITFPKKIDLLHELAKDTTLINGLD